MQSLLVSCGVVTFLFLYGAGLFLAVNTIKQASRWFEQHRICGQWPRTRRDLTIKSVDQNSVACELPKISVEPHSKHSLAKEILRETCETCPAGDDACSP